MLAAVQALRIAEKAVPDGAILSLDALEECREAWFFHFGYHEPMVGGYRGLIVNKHSGACRHFGTSRYPLERDLTAYDAGYQFEWYDLVVEEVHSRRKTLDLLERLEITVEVLEWEHRSVWSKRRPLSRRELHGRLAELPCVFGRLRLYHFVELLQDAKQEGYCQFVAVECTRALS